MAYLSDSSGRREVYQRVIRGVLDYFREIDQLGGTLQAKADGFFRDEISQSSSRYDQQVNSGERRIIGVNRYSEGRKESRTVSRVEVSDEVKRKRVDDVRRFKEQRDPKKVKMGIQKLQGAASSGENVFEVTMAIVKQVTLDEWTHALQEVYGMYRRKI